MALGVCNPQTLCQIYYVTLSALPRFGCLTRFSGTFQMCRVPGVFGWGLSQLPPVFTQGIGFQPFRDTISALVPAARCPILLRYRMSSGRTIQVTLLGEVACPRRKRLMVHSALSYKSLVCLSHSRSNHRSNGRTMFLSSVSRYSSARASPFRLYVQSSFQRCDSLNGFLSKGVALPSRVCAQQGWSARFCEPGGGETFPTG
jgi:hypothetical protein